MHFIGWGTFLNPYTTYYVHLSGLQCPSLYDSPVTANVCPGDCHYKVYFTTGWLLDWAHALSISSVYSQCRVHFLVGAFPCQFSRVLVLVSLIQTSEWEFSAFDSESNLLILCGYWPKSHPSIHSYHWEEILLRWKFWNLDAWIHLAKIDSFSGMRNLCSGHYVEVFIAQNSNKSSLLYNSIYQILEENVWSQSFWCHSAIPYDDLFEELDLLALILHDLCK